MTGESSAPRLLLLEFLFDDPFGRDKSEHYPFLLGQARALELAATWSVCGIYSCTTEGHLDRHLVELTAAEIERLADEIAAFGPTHVIPSEALGADVARAMADRFPDVRFIDLRFDPAARSLRCPASWLPAALGLPTAEWEGQYLVDAVHPDYENRLVPPPPGQRIPTKPYIAVLGGPTCTYAAKIAANRFYQGVELPGGLGDVGCAFCRKDDVRYRFKIPPVELALRQCLAASRTANRFSDDAYLIRGTIVALRIGKFLRQLLAQPFPPSQFLFSYRIDELLRVADEISAVLPRLQAAGHSIVVYNPGVENFSREENERFNKGISLEQVDGAVEHIKRWSKDYPNTFSFQIFGLILFTPWTTLDDVAVNYEQLSRLLGEGIKLEWSRLRSKLQIFPETAIARLARRDGALVDDDDGFLVWDGRVAGNSQAPELPWRFLHADVADFYDLVWRLTTGEEQGADRDDALLIEIRALYEARPDLWPNMLAFLLDALAAVREPPRPVGARAMMERLRAKIPPRSRPVAKSQPDRPNVDPPNLHVVRTRQECLLAEKADVARAALARLDRAPRSPLPGWRLAAFRGESVGSVFGFSVELEKGGDWMALRILPADVPHAAFTRSGPVQIAYQSSTPLDTEPKRRGVLRLCQLLARYLDRP